MSSKTAYCKNRLQKVVDELLDEGIDPAFIVFACSEICVAVVETHRLKSLLLETVAAVAAYHAQAGQRRSPRTVEVLKFIGRQKRASIADVWTYLDTIGMRTTYNTVLQYLVDHTKAGRLQRVARGIYALTDAGAARIGLPVDA